ncbi:DNA cytosine methyltransferase [Chlorobium sp.]|uniref:DNA cytosine methyltransferase n=1 Tax=Chlorobium sp. TaxID=1095 RepID=UPI003C3A3DF5
MKQLRLDIEPEIIIDNFAGGGGASTGIELALGRRVTVAINHDPEAIAMHTANHPETEHYCESVWDVNPRDVKPGRPIGLLWLSPDCKHFSKAKGGKPVEKGIRGLAWVALRWAATRQPRVIMLENVEEFLTWGPIGPDGRPCKKNKGREFKAFRNALNRQGYQVEWRELRACDYGAPTIRKRLFLIARRDGMPIVWPEPTHGPGLKPYRTAAECIDWSLPCPSIFERQRPLAEATCRRIAKGIMRYVVNAAEPFIINTRNGEKSGQKPRVRSINDPAWTITAQGSQGALVAPVFTECANASSPRCMTADEPLRTICAQTKGGHHALVTAFLAKHYGGVIGSSLESPIGTVTGVDYSRRRRKVCIGYQHNLIKMRGNNVGQATDEPLRTISAGGTHFAEVRAFLVKYYGNEQDGVELSEPLHTVTSRDRFGLVTVDGQEYSITDIGMRMLAPRELFRAQGFPDDYIIGDRPEQGLILTKTAQVRMCGNSVSPPLASALVAENVPEMAVERSCVA